MALVTVAVWFRFCLVFASHAVRPQWWRLTVGPALLRLKTD
jgi:hypothetical protein